MKVAERIALSIEPGLRGAALLVMFVYILVNLRAIEFPTREAALERLKGMRLVALLGHVAWPFAIFFAPLQILLKIRETGMQLMDKFLGEDGFAQLFMLPGRLVIEGPSALNLEKTQKAKKMSGSKEEQGHKIEDAIKRGVPVTETVWRLPFWESVVLAFVIIYVIMELPEIIGAVSKSTGGLAAVAVA